LGNLKAELTPWTIQLGVIRGNLLGRRVYSVLQTGCSIFLGTTNVFLLLKEGHFPAHWGLLGRKGLGQDIKTRLGERLNFAQKVLTWGGNFPYALTPFFFKGAHGPFWENGVKTGGLKFFILTGVLLGFGVFLVCRAVYSNLLNLRDYLQEKEQFPLWDFRGSLSERVSQLRVGLSWLDGVWTYWRCNIPSLDLDSLEFWVEQKQVNQEGLTQERGH